MPRPDTCVIIPAYNNAAALGSVISTVMAVTPHVLVVNDGSTDDTDKVLEGFTDVRVVRYQPNRGKGWALRQGFKQALALGYRYAITIDADGQHSAADLAVFMDAVETNPGALIVGDRNMNQATVPGGSSFGRRFSNFWFRLETGISCPDTQSGFRLYPIFLFGRSIFFTRKYEFEIEVLVRAAWKGIPVISVPVSVHYPPVGERISHFRPFWDFARISVLNAVLVLISFFYVRPMHFLHRKKDKP